MGIFRLLILTLCFLCAQETSAQQYEFGINGYASGYMGDINPRDPFYYTNGGAGLYAQYNVNPTWGWRIAFNQLTLVARDQDFNGSDANQRKLSFINHISELSLLSEFHFFNYSVGGKHKSYSPYLIGGLGLIKHDPFVYYEGNKVTLRSLKLERDKENNPINYTVLAFVIPLGLGFKYNVKGPWTIGVELNYRIVLSDNIDNISGYYPKEDIQQQELPLIKIKNKEGTIRNFDTKDWQFLADPSANYIQNSGTLRGDAKQWDGYMTAGISLTYTMRNTKCTW